MAKIYKDFEELIEKNKGVFKILGKKKATSSYRAVWDARQIEVDNLTRENNDLKTENQKGRKKIKDLNLWFENSELREKEALKKLDHEINNKNQLQEQLNQSIDRANSLDQQLKNFIEKYEDEKQKTVDNNDSNQKLIDGLKEEFLTEKQLIKDGHEQATTELEKNHDETTKKLEDKIEKQNSLITQFGDAIQLSKSIQNELENEILQHKRDKEQLGLDLEIANMQTKETLSDLEFTKLEFHQTNSEKEKLKEMIKKLQKNLETNSVEAKRNLQIAKDHQNEIHQELMETKEKLHLQNCAAGRMMKEEKQFKLTIQKLEDKITENSDTINKLKLELEDSREQLLRTSTEKDKIEEELFMQNTVVSDYKEMQKQADSKIEELRGQNQHLAMRIQSMQNKLQSVMSSLDNLNSKEEDEFGELPGFFKNYSGHTQTQVQLDN